jgi:thymidylate kinase
MLIVIEGIDGSGKDTQADALRGTMYNSDASVALAELAATIASDRSLELGEAMTVALAERPDLASRLYAL